MQRPCISMTKCETGPLANVKGALSYLCYAETPAVRLNEAISAPSAQTFNAGTFGLWVIMCSFKGSCGGSCLLVITNEPWCRFPAVTLLYRGHIFSRPH